MKKNIIVTLIIIFAIFAVLATLRFLGGEDTWICQDGEWVKHGHPSAPTPEKPCPGGKDEEKEQVGPEMRLNEPITGAEVISPVTVKGEARGYWYFEASFPLRIEDMEGRVLATGIAQAEGDWMTEDFVPFVTALSFDVATRTEAILILEKDNPSGLPENAKEFVRGLVLLPGGQSKNSTVVKAYFINNRLDPDISCIKVFPVERTIELTQAIGRAALLELLKGTAASEEADGYSTAINSGVTLNSLTIQNQVARADFDARLNEGVAGSCLVSFIQSQIKETLKQFPAVDRVIILINGQSEGILEP